MCRLPNLAAHRRAKINHAVRISLGKFLSARLQNLRETRTVAFRPTPHILYCLLLHHDFTPPEIASDRRPNGQNHLRSLRRSRSTSGEPNAGPWYWRQPWAFAGAISVRPATEHGRSACGFLSLLSPESLQLPATGQCRRKKYACVPQWFHPFESTVHHILFFGKIHHGRLMQSVFRWDANGSVHSDVWTCIWTN
jgi:hypothetical protein